MSDDDIPTSSELKKMCWSPASVALAVVELLKREMQSGTQRVQTGPLHPDVRAILESKGYHTVHTLGGHIVFLEKPGGR
jgi:hypothetical protein